MATIVYENNFRDNVDSVLSAQGNGSLIFFPTGPVAVPDRLRITNAPDGVSALHASLISSDPDTVGGQRSEISMPTNPANTELWFVWSIFVPDSWETNTSQTFSLMQIHDSPDAGDPARAPNFGLVTRNNIVQVYVTNTAPVETFGTEVIGSYPLITGRWVRCCLHVSWRVDSGGFLEFIYAGHIIAKQWSKANHYPDVNGPYLKLGMYDYFNGGGSFGARECWYKDLICYSGAGDYIAVLGAPPKALFDSLIV